MRAADRPAATPAAYYGEVPTLAVEEGELDGIDAIVDTPIEDVPRDPVAPGSTASSNAAASNPGSVAPEPPAASRWIVDGLVGQINGRPVFADEFFEPLESKIEQLTVGRERNEARVAIERLIHDRFEVLVNSELVISEAESELTPEQQQGVFAWLRSLQEEEIASRKGTRAEANKSLEEERGMTIDEFLAQRRDEEMTKYLLNKKVSPRTIVSWADVERYFRENEDKINPPPVVRMGAFSLSKRTDAAKIETATTMFASGATFVEVARAVGARNEGIVFSLPNIERVAVGELILNHPDLTARAKERFGNLTPGVVPPPVETATTVEWVAIVDVVELPKRTIYDPDLQVEIKNRLRGMHMSIEQTRYINRLRSRWISDDITLIEQRLVAIAIARYLP